MTTFPRALTLLLLAGAGCKTGESVPEAAPPAAGAAAPAIESTTFAPSLGVDLAASTKHPSGLYYRDLVVGSGAPVVAGQEVSVHYEGTFVDGAGFDKSGPNDPPFTFRPGNHEVIDGWDLGVVGMRVGGRRQLIIPPALGYGATANGPIPANSILVFIVEVVSAR